MPLLALSNHKKVISHKLKFFKLFLALNKQRFKIHFFVCSCDKLQAFVFIGLSSFYFEHKHSLF